MNQAELLEAVTDRVKVHHDRAHRLNERILAVRAALNQMITDGDGATQEDLYRLRAMLSVD